MCAGCHDRQEENARLIKINKELRSTLGVYQSMINKIDAARPAYIRLTNSQTRWDGDNPLYVADKKIMDSLDALFETP